MGHFEAPGYLTGNKAEDMNEFRKIKSVEALCDIDRWEYFERTREKASNNKSILRCKL